MLRYVPDFISICRDDNHVGPDQGLLLAEDAFQKRFFPICFCTSIHQFKICFCTSIHQFKAADNIQRKILQRVWTNRSFDFRKVCIIYIVYSHRPSIMICISGQILDLSTSGTFQYIWPNPSYIYFGGLLIQNKFETARLLSILLIETK